MPGLWSAWSSSGGEGEPLRHIDGLGWDHVCHPGACVLVRFSSIHTWIKKTRQERETLQAKPIRSPSVLELSRYCNGISDSVESAWWLQHCGYSTQAGAIERGLPGPIRREREENAHVQDIFEKVANVLKEFGYIWVDQLIQKSSESLIEGLCPTKSLRRAPSVGGLNRGRRQNFAVHLFSSGQSQQAKRRPPALVPLENPPGSSEGSQLLAVMPWVYLRDDDSPVVDKWGRAPSSDSCRAGTPPTCGCLSFGPCGLKNHQSYLTDPFQFVDILKPYSFGMEPRNYANHVVDVPFPLFPAPTPRRPGSGELEKDSLSTPCAPGGHPTSSMRVLSFLGLSTSPTTFEDSWPSEDKWKIDLGMLLMLSFWISFLGFFEHQRLCRHCLGCEAHAGLRWAPSLVRN